MFCSTLRAYYRLYIMNATWTHMLTIFVLPSWFVCFECVSNTAPFVAYPSHTQLTERPPPSPPLFTAIGTTFPLHSGVVHLRILLMAFKNLSNCGSSMKPIWFGKSMGLPVPITVLALARSGVGIYSEPSVLTLDSLSQNYSLESSSIRTESTHPASGGNTCR